MGARLLDGAGRVVGCEDNLQVSSARVLLLDAAREFFPVQVEGVALGNPPAQNALLPPDGAEAGEGGLGIPLEAEHDAGVLGPRAEGGFGERTAHRLLLLPYGLRRRQGALFDDGATWLVAPACLYFGLTGKIPGA